MNWSFTPNYIRQTEAQVALGTVTAARWNELWNLNITQGDHSEIALNALINTSLPAFEAELKAYTDTLEGKLATTAGASKIGVNAITGVTGTTVQAVAAGLKSLIDTCYKTTDATAALALKESVADANALVKTVSFDSATGTFVFTHQSGSTTVIDTNFEKAVVNFSYDTANQRLVLVDTVGNTSYISLSDFITETEFVDSAQLDFSVNAHSVTATIKSGSITDAMLSSALITTLQGYVSSANTAATNAAASEANASTYKTNAANSATAAANSATAAANSASSASGSANSAASSAGTATQKATAASDSAAAAAASESNAHTSAQNAADSASQAAAIVGGDYLLKTGDASNVTNAFTKASSRANLVTGEKLSVSLGKIMKYFADLGTAAFSAASSFAAAGHTHVKANITDFPTSLKNPSALTFGSKTYDGSAAATVTAADLGAVTNGAQIIAYVDTGSSVSATDGTHTVSGTSVNGSCTLAIPNYGTWTVTATLSGDTTSATITVDTVKIYSVTLSYIHIYGVLWDGTSTTALSRTDDAAGFTNPVPYISGATNYSSPFDNIQPWAGMVRTTDATAGALVAIPKYWFKWTKSGNSMKLQIADKATAGFSVSPAHADRGDGRGERDTVYVGRYHCNSSYKSVTGASPQADITRASARSSIHAVGSTIWQYDFAMYWTIMMLYLVEFADWNSQAKIGYGCGNNSAAQAVGASDSMPYHTGTMQASRTTYGVGCQYRYIEGLWDNVYDWCDGIYFSGTNIYCIKNPTSFSDISYGTNIGTRPTSGDYISAWSISSVSGFEYALYPSAVAGNESTYVCDYCGYNSSGVVLHCGGCCNQNQSHGLFYLNGSYAASNSGASIGCRLQKLP